MYVRCNDSEIQLWVNGEEGTDRLAIGSVRNTNDCGVVGNKYTGSRLYFNGTVADVLMYRTGLNIPEMAAIINKVIDDSTNI